MNWTLDASYSHCQRVARSAASNFYFTFFLLPRAKRRAMSALYAFLRHTDDLADCNEPAETRRAALDRWRRSLGDALESRFDGPLWPALADTVVRFDIPPVYLHDAIDGAVDDLDHTGFETFADLERYCHKVASSVGLACLHIWGFDGPAALEPARACGVAFQLTNILRDLKEDAQRGRVYPPREDLRRFEYSSDDLLRGVRDERFRALMRFEIERAEALYREAAKLEAHLGPDGRPIFAAMTALYRGLLDEIRRRDGDVFDGRVRLSLWRKLSIASRCLMQGSPLTRLRPPLGAGRS